MAQAIKLTKPEIERRRAAAERARGVLGHDPGGSYSDELIAERRAEARAENREDKEGCRSLTERAWSWQRGSACPP